MTAFDPKRPENRGGAAPEPDGEGAGRDNTEEEQQGEENVPGAEITPQPLDNSGVEEDMATIALHPTALDRPLAADRVRAGAPLEGKTSTAATLPAGTVRKDMGGDES